MSDAWIVGGALRDELLERPVRDVDVAVAGDPARAARALAAELKAPVFRLSEAFGAWRVIDRRGGRVYDFAPLQGETIEADLAKRDFTINAMARPVELEALGGAASAADLVDPLGGRADLASRTLRVLGPEAYESDPLRALRLARFSAELGFAPDPETERLTRAAAPRVTEAAGERVFAELRRLVIASGVLDGLALADRLGVLEAVLPELTALHGVDQSHYHHLDVYDHTLEVVAETVAIERDPGGAIGDDALELGEHALGGHAGDARRAQGRGRDRGLVADEVQLAGEAREAQDPQRV
ncbi:MAG: poly(A) polymerase, partial [Thermoleophilaceae bacterium]|nr:poly(A) polymerase [Thermoleophilaceae bacterium]